MYWSPDISSFTPSYRDLAPAAIVLQVSRSHVGHTLLAGVSSRPHQTHSPRRLRARPQRSRFSNEPLTLKPTKMSGAPDSKLHHPTCETTKNMLNTAKTTRKNGRLQPSHAFRDCNH